MKTVAFYSYKGGVGRTLALSNIAMRLSDFHKKVCVLDFDLEAPGVHYKFKSMFKNQPFQLQKGIVDYIHEFAVNKKIPDSIENYSYELQKPYNINVIPAGNPDLSLYWKKLSAINWYDLLYGNNAEGIPFFFHLKNEIEKKIKPDYLLIDTRTGITDISSITISLLADQIVLLAANNEENISGCRRIIKSLLSQKNNLLDKDRDLILALTRIPYPQTPEDKLREKMIVENFTKNFQDISSLASNSAISPVIIHSDRDIECSEEFKIGYTFEISNGQKEIAKEYLNLFGEITKNDFTENEKTLFEEEKKKERLYYSIHQINNPEEATKQIKHYIKSYPDDDYLYFLLAVSYNSLLDYSNALKSINEAFKILPINYYKFYRTGIYFSLHQYEKAYKEILQIKDYDNLIYYGTYLLIKTYTKDFSMEELKAELSVYENSNDNNLVEKYNTIACIYRKIGDYKKAIENIYKALNLEKENAYLYTTLAEIMSNKDNDIQFYFNIEMALKYNVDLRISINQNKDIYKKYFHDPQFIDLLKRYDKEDVINYIFSIA